MGRLSPSASAREAKECLRSWIRTSSSPARVRMRRPGMLKIGQVGARPLADDNPGIALRAGAEGESTATDARDNGTIRAPVLLSWSLNSPAARSTSSQRRVWISFRRQPVNISRRMAVTAENVSEPSASASFSTWPSRRNSSSVRKPLALLLLVLLHEPARVRPVLAQAPGFGQVEHLSDHLEDPVRLIGRLAVSVVQRRDVLAFHRLDRELAQLRQHEFHHQPAIGLLRPGLAMNLGMLLEIALRQIGDSKLGHPKRMEWARGLLPP